MTESDRLIAQIDYARCFLESAKSALLVERGDRKSRLAAATIAVGEAKDALGVLENNLNESSNG